MKTPTDKLHGINESPNVLSQTAPENVRRKLRTFLDEGGNDTAKTAQDIFSTLVKQNKKMGKMDGERGAECTREIEAVLAKLLEKKDATTVLDDEDMMAFAMQIVVLYTATVGGRILLDPALSAMLEEDKSLAQALEASLVKMGLASKMSLALEKTGNIFFIALSLTASGYGAQTAVADALNTTEWANPNAAFVTTMGASAAIAALMAKILYDFKSDVRENMMAAEPLTEEQWRERPIGTAVRHYGRTVKEGLKGGIHDFVRDRKWVKNVVFASLMLAAVQAVDGATNGLMVGDASLGTVDRSEQVSAAIATFDQRTESLKTQLDEAKAKTAQDVQAAVDKKLREEAGEERNADGSLKLSETGVPERGPVYHAKDWLWNEDPTAQRYLGSKSDFSRGLLQVTDDTTLVEGRPLSAEVEGVFDARKVKLEARLAEIQAIEDDISAMQPAELTQAKLNQMVAELGKIMEELNKENQDEVSQMLAKYKEANRSIVDYAISAGGPSYGKASAGAIEDIKVGEFKIDNPPIELSMENRSTITLLEQMSAEKGVMVALSLAALFAALGLVPTNTELLILTPINARTGQKKKAEKEAREAKFFKPAIESLVDVLEFFLNKGSAATLLHTQKISREQIRAAVMAFLNEETGKGGLLENMVNFREIQDHNARVAKAQRLTEKGPQVMLALLRRILPGIDALMQLEDKQVGEATRINDEHITNKRKEAEAEKVDREDGPVSKMENLDVTGEPLAFCKEAGDLLAELEKEMEEPWEYDESKKKVMDAVKTWVAKVTEFVNDEAGTILADCAEEGDSTKMKAALAKLIEAIEERVGNNFFTETGCDATALTTLLAKLKEKMKQVAVAPYLKHVESFVAPEHKGTAVQAAKTYKTAMEGLMSKVPAHLTNEEKDTIKGAIVAATGPFLGNTIAYLVNKLTPEGNISTFNKKQVADAKKTIAAFEKEMAENPFAEQLYPAGIQATVQGMKEKLEAREAALIQELKEAQIDDLKNFDYTDQSVGNVNKLITIVLGNEASALAVEEEGKVVLKIDKREKELFDQVMNDLIGGLGDAEKVALQEFVSGLAVEELANGGLPLLQADYDDLEPGLTDSNHFEVGTDLYGNPVLVASDHGVNNRTQNQDSTGVNLHTGAVIMVDGMSGTGNQLDGGKFSQELTHQFVASKNPGLSLEDALDEATTQTRTTLAGEIGTGAGGVVSAYYLSNGGKQLDVASVGTVRIRVLKSNGSVWESKQEGVTGAGIVTNSVHMDGAPVNWNTETHLVEPGDRVLMCTDGLLTAANEEKILALAAAVNLKDSAAVEDFLRKLEALSNSIGDNRAIALTVIE